MQEIEVIIDKKIYIKCSECDRELRSVFRKAYTFKSNKTFGGNVEYRTVYSKEIMNGVEVYSFPPNTSYFNEKIIKEFKDKVKFRYVDLRVCPKVEGFVSNVIPRENQVQVLKDMEAVRYNALITAKTSFGKAQPISEPILTPKGWSTMGEIKINDYVIGSKGTPIKVLGEFPQGERAIYKIDFIDGTFTYCDLEHLWTVYNRGNTKKTLTVKEMLDTWIYRTHINSKTRNINTEYNYSIDVCPELHFGEDKDLLINPYLLGLILGDGGLTSGGVKFTTGSPEILKKFEGILPSTDILKYNSTKGKGSTYRVSKKIKGKGKCATELALETLGLMKHLSVDKFIPKQYLEASLPVRKALFQGLVDTDGYMLNGFLREYSTSSKQLALDFLELGRSLGKVLSIKERIPKYKYKGEIKTGQKSYRIYEKRTPRKSIINIEFSHREEAKCIMVDADDKLYVTRGYNLTHNTALSLYLAELLKTPMLFIAARTNLINNFSLIECKKFGINPEHITEINSEWLKNPIITPIMVSSVQALSEEILEELYNKIGLVIFDEIHISATSEVYSERVFSINAKHKLYLSATPANSDYGIEFTKAMLSNNVIDSPEQLDFKIDLVTLNGTVPQAVHLGYNTVYTSHEKREVLFTEQYIKKICELGYCLVNEGRGVLIYNDDNSTQEQIGEMLRMWAVRVGILNSNTSSKDKKEILENFDNGKYQILVSGASISAGVSLNRLSCIIDTSIKINENNLQQLLGRLKRVDKEVCDKSKLYVKVTAQGLSSKKWHNDINALKEFDYINFHKEVRLEHYAKFSLVRAYKDFRKNLI